MKINLEPLDIEKISNVVAENLKNDMVPIIHDLFDSLAKPDELLSKKEVYTHILKCNAETAEELYFSQPDFPVLIPNGRKDGRKTHLRFSRKAVEKWIESKVIDKSEIHNFY